MKRKNNSIYIEIKNKKICYDDIKNIISILQEIENNELTIETNKYYLDSIEEIFKIDDNNLTIIKITNKNPFIFVEIAPNKINIFASEDNFKSKGIIEELKNYINNLPSDKSESYRMLGVNMSYIFVAFFISWLINKYINSSINIYLIALLVYPIIALLCLYCVPEFQKNKKTLKLNINKNENFFSKNKDEIIIGIAMTFLGIILGKIFDIF